MKRIKLKVLGISYSQTQSGAYALVLVEDNGERRIPIIIGGFEAQSIVIKLENLNPPRPLTHDLFKSFAELYQVTLKEVIIDQFRQGVFHAKLVCVHNNTENQIDSRTSDAVALAIRFKCPIYTYEKIIAETGVPIDEKAGGEEPPIMAADVPEGNEFDDLTMNDLEEILQKAVESEDYELASKIRDEIQKRKIKLYYPGTVYLT